MVKDSFIIYSSFYKPISKLSDKQLGRLFRAIFNYHINGAVTVEEDIEMAFAFFVNQFEIDESKYQSKVERNRESGRKGGLSRINRDDDKNLTGYGERLRTKRTLETLSEKSERLKTERTLETLSYNDNDNVNDNDNISSSVDDDEKKEASSTSSSKIEDEIKEMKNDAIWKEPICMKFRIDKSDLDRLLDEFSLDCRCSGKLYHDNRNDARRHFCSWLTKKNANEANRQTSHVQRRGTDADSDQPKDYNATF